MSTTLTNGLKLPDKGSVDWYADMQSNYAILDGAVGTVAEHTSQIAGKAPLVHTHTKADITDFPVYGTTAGTICEGNDSRLSDARTPVAHTHTKSEITDFPTNVSAFTNDSGYANDNNVVHKTGNETVGGTKTFTKNIKNQSENFEIGVIPSSTIGTGYQIIDKNNVIVANLYYNQYSSGNSELKLNLRTKDSNNNAVSKSVLLNTDQYGTWFNFRPSDNSSISLGSANYRWSAVYSDSYYYGTTAWGLDKANVWSNINSYQREITIAGDRNAYIAPMWEGASSGIAFLNSDATKTFVFGQRLIDTEHDNRSVVDITKGRIIIRTGERNNETVVDFEPRAANAALGTATAKWKTLNSINPGALSLPKNESGRYSLTELSSISGIGVDNWVLDGGKIVIAAEYVITGWLYVCIACNTDGYVILQTGGYSYPNCFYKSTGTPIAGYASAMIPIVEGIALTLYLKGTSLIHARYYPAAGNV